MVSVVRCAGPPRGTGGDLVSTESAVLTVDGEFGLLILRMMGSAPGRFLI